MAGDPIHIRYATSDDAALLADVGAQSFHEAYAADIAAPRLAAYIEDAFGDDQQAAELADPNACFLIAQVGAVVVGYAKLRMNTPPSCISGAPAIELERLYVLDAWIGRGVGARLMRACLDEATARGCVTMWLGVWERNTRALAFYNRWSFVQAGSHVFQMGDEAQTDLLMQRAVGG
jgi:GNAT superfamily N-acetyltransferase